MVKRPVYDKGQLVRKALSVNEVFCIGDDCPVADYHTLGLSCCAGGVKHFRRALCNRVGRKFSGDCLEHFLRNVFGQRCHRKSKSLVCKVISDVFNGRESPQADDA